MIPTVNVLPTGVASFAASFVECVEALTVVLAVGTVRGWRWALIGTVAAVLTLGVMVAVFGPALADIPIEIAQLVVGTLLLMFGLRWLLKAILRYIGAIALHDESATYAKQTKALAAGRQAANAPWDKVAFLTAYKIVMLEGLEVVFIVIAIGSSGRLLAAASVGAAVAFVAVIVLGMLLHEPLAKVPENTLKFGVGVLLTAFGTLWVGEGIGIAWPGADLSLLALVTCFLVLGLVLVAWGRRRFAPAVVARPVAANAAPQPTPPRGALRGIAAEMVGLIVDDGVLALGTVAWVGILWFGVWQWHAAAEFGSYPLVLGLVALLAYSVARGFGAGRLRGA